MNTRSQAKAQSESKTLYDVFIDFDIASESWKYNKKSIGNGNYKYICCVLKANGEKCNIKCINGEQYCRIHNKKIQKEKI
jgi:hypothetical protein